MTKIFHIISGLKVGGAEKALYRLITNFNSDNYVHTVISLTKGGPISKDLKEKNVNVVVFDFKQNLFREFWKLFLFIKKAQPDIVNTWMYHANVIGGIAARFAGVRKIIWSLRTTDVKESSKWLTKLIRRIGALLSYFIPETIICVAEAVKLSHSNIGYSKNIMITIHNGFDVDQMKFNNDQRVFLREQLSFDSNIILIGSLGRFNKAKDQYNFISAAGIIAKKWPNVRFLMVGEGLTNDNTELNSWAKDVGIEGKLILLGERYDVGGCLSSMDIFCLHSSREGFPNALAEAMLIGLPCVSTNVGDVELLLKEIGVVVKVNDSIALSNGLSKLLRLSLNERNILGKKLRNKNL